MASVASASAGVPAYLLPGPPVVQPPHLDGDASLATEILPGPPSLAVVQAAAYKRPVPLSYMPTTDPGSSYVGWPAQAALAAPANPDEPRRKRARTDKGRVYVAPSRGLNAIPAALALTPPLLDDEPIASTSQDLTLLDDLSLSAPPEPPLEPAVDVATAVEPTISGRPRRMKAKGKEKAPFVKVKDEPVTISLAQMEPLGQVTTRTMRNEDHCSSCRTVAVGGGLVYCDSCPRAFHFMCLNPPLSPNDVGEGDWFCPACVPPSASSARSRNALLGPLIQHVQTSAPVEFQLPEDIRGFFKDVGSDTRGTYMDSSRIRQGRLDRHGRPEERDPYRLRDRNGGPVICFRCGQSSLPLDDPGPGPSESKRPRRAATAKTVNIDSGRTIVSCDYCDLHWHFDCLDPPMMTLPSSHKKWMCPAHAEHVVPRPRMPRLNNPPIEITRPGQKNNGNIEIIRSDVSAPPPRHVETDEAIINGQRYRIPERIVMLDFWSKLSRGKPNADFDETSSSSSLSTLTSLDSEDGEVAESHAVDNRLDERTAEDFQLAQLLCGLKYNLLHYPQPHERTPAPPAQRAYASASTQTDPADAKQTSQQTPVIPNGRVRSERASSQRPPTAKRNHQKKPPTPVLSSIPPSMAEGPAPVTAVPRTIAIPAASPEESQERRTRPARATRKSSAAAAVAKASPSASSVTPDQPPARVAAADATPSSPAKARLSMSPRKPTDGSPGTSASLKIRLPPRAPESANGASDALPVLPRSVSATIPPPSDAVPGVRTRRKSSKARLAMGTDDQDPI